MVRHSGRDEIKQERSSAGPSCAISAAATLDLDAAQTGVYMTMLLLAWQREDAALPNDDSPTREWCPGAQQLKSAMPDREGAFSPWRLLRVKVWPGLGRR
jgi:hypothetical protein